ncbi:MAG: hypothetical protein HY544_01910 [Candidatus Diapherotrites archaeon]|uniref:Uncharacterized protein n=1 Tax=Candidatus Iainarchaeum sp. TaxID=3101447 RepID=A0A8T3YN00_9ARCH|nr:hypothetical protein [Candidatus Diapherotrites archaeon]
MLKDILKKQLDAYSGGPWLVYLHGFGAGLCALFVGIIKTDLLFLATGLFLIILGPLYCRLRKLQVDFNDEKFRIVLLNQIILAVIFYVAVLLFELSRL